MIRTRARGAVLLAVSALGLALTSACGSYGSSSATSVKNQTSAGGQDTLSLIAKQVDSVGSVVTDSKGMTLYRFDKDTANPSASNCEGPCADTWPPMTTTATQIHLEGVDKNLVATIARKDGSVQLTLGGWPLYRYAKDTAAGDAKGQGVGNAWFASTAQGKKATASANTPNNSAPNNNPAPNNPAPNNPPPADNGGSGY
jgi:predicted lipoprotein with Yx(FWY)xxD motif